MSAEHPYDWAVSGAPLGRWGTVHGSFGVVMQEQLHLKPDGTGILDCTSALRGQETVNLAWRHIEPGHLQLLELDAGQPGEVSADDVWQSIHYRVDWCVTDCGENQPVLRNCTEEVFWVLSGPVQLLGR